MATSSPNPNLATFDKAVAQSNPLPASSKISQVAKQSAFENTTRASHILLLCYPDTFVMMHYFRYVNRRTLNTVWVHFLSRIFIFFCINYSNIDYCSTTRVSRPSHCCSESTRVERFEHEHSNLFPRG